MIASQEKIGGYRLVRPLARGGMGTVWEGFDEALERRVAIKLLSPALAANQEFRQRFLREARVLARLNHPNVAQIYSAGARGDELYYAMEHVSGVSLDRLLSRPGRMPAEQALCDLLQCLDGLEEAARLGIVHRDIKPANLMREPTGRIKIVDFGLAHMEGRDGGVTDAGEVLGTPYYMSPEQAQGGGTDLRSDIYSLGATFYHLLSGAPLFEADSAVGVVLAHVNTPPEPLAAREPASHPGLAAVIDRMVRKRPDQRFADYPALRQALLDCGVPLGRTPAAPASLAAAETTTPARVPGRARPRSAPLTGRRRPPRRAVLLGAGFAACVALALVVTATLPPESLAPPAPRPDEPAAPGILDGGFEGPAPGTPGSPWRLLSGPAALGSAALDARVRHGGSSSLRIDVRGLPRLARPGVALSQELDGLERLRGKTLRLEAWVHAEGAQAELKLGRSPREGLVTVSPRSTASFTRIEQLYVVPSSSPRVVVFLTARGDPGGRVWIDDLSIDVVR